MTYQLMIERVMHAPPAALWSAYTDHLHLWFCPPPWRAEVKVMDLRAGGRCAVTMYGPEGEVANNEGIYLEVVPERRIIATDAVTHDWQPAGPFVITGMELIPDGDTTLYRGWARHWTQEARDRHADMGFTQGWTQVAEQWEGVARQLAGLPPLS